MLNRDPLLCWYIKLIGRIKRHPKTAKPKRTIEQVEQFIDSILHDDVSTFNKVLFEEIKIQRLPPPNLEMPNGFIIGCKQAEVRSYEYIKEGMKYWPDILIDLRRLFIRLNAPNPDNDLHPLYKKQAYHDGESALAHARTSLANRNFDQAVTLFTFAKNGFDEAALPSRRWYLHSPFGLLYLTVIAFAAAGKY